MTLETKIQNFINKSLTKSRAIATDLNARFDRYGFISKDAQLLLMQSYEIKNFTNLLVKPGRGGLTDKETNDLIDFFWNWLELNKISFVVYSNLQTIIQENITVPSGTYALQSDLAAEINARQSADGNLNARVQVLEDNQLDPSTFFPAGFFDLQDTSDSVVWDDDPRLHTHDNKSVLDQISEDLLEDLEALQAHYDSIGNPSGVHVSSGDRTNWNAKLSPGALATILTDYAAKNHTHDISDINGLTGIIDQINIDIADMAGADGREVELQASGTNIQWRYVGDADWIDLGDFKGDQGDQGDPFKINARGTSADMLSPAYNGQDDTFTYLQEDTGYLYFRNPLGGPATSPSGWNNGIQFLGHSGWAPMLASVEISSSRVVQYVIDWVGGSGNKPVLDPGPNPPNPIRWYIGLNGFTLLQASATNIKGPQGPSKAPKVDAAGSLAGRGAYDAQPEGFTYLRTDVSPQTVFIKNTDDLADWGPELPWQGPPGPAGPISSASRNVDGGTPTSIYTPSQVVDGGTP